MKTYIELTEEEKKSAKFAALSNILDAIADGVVKFDDSLQNKIDSAIEKAESMRTPWFFADYIMDTCKEELESIAEEDAKSALYSEPGEYILSGIINPS